MNLEQRLIDFSIAIIKSSQNVKTDFAGSHLLKQIIRSGTSVSLNYGESRGAESRKDFTHKMKLVVKELRETHVNLKIMDGAGLFRNAEKGKMLENECNELISIFVASIKTIDSRN